MPNLDPIPTAPAVEGDFNPQDLSNGYYPQLRKVAVDDPEFLDILRWLESKGAPRYDRLFAPRAMVASAADNPRLPTEIQWLHAPRGPLSLDAVLVFNFPHVALTDLRRHFGIGNPNVLEMYPGIRKPVAYVSRSPVGEQWPEQGPRAYRPAEWDSNGHGAEYVDETGRYRKQKRRWAFVSFGVWIKDAE